MQMASQLGLFGRTTTPLVDDATGRIVYYPDVLDVNECAELFALVLDQAPWKNEQMWMYDKMVDVPRKSAHYGSDCPPLLMDEKTRIEALLDYRFSNVSLNYYRDGRDSVAWHSDRVEELRPNPTIALLSLGSTRQMLLRTKERPRKTFAIDLDPGSVFVMSGPSQDYWEHTIPKTLRPADARISIAFRPYRG
jgi:alkylated DNA repair dioxygenase AlkB